MLRTNLEETYCPWSNSISSQPEMAFDHLLGSTATPHILPAPYLERKLWSCKVYLVGRSFLSLFSLDFVNRRNHSLFTLFYEIDYVDRMQHIHIFQSDLDHFLSLYLLYLLAHITSWCMYSDTIHSSKYSLTCQKMRCNIATSKSEEKH